MFTKLYSRVKLFLPLLAGLALMASCKDETVTAFNKLACQNSPQTLGADGTATLTFYCYWDWEANPDSERQNQPVIEIPVKFTAVGGTCTESATTDRNGLVTCVFKASNLATFEGGTVTATVERFFRDGTGREEYAISTATAVGEILPGERPSKEKAKPKIKIIGDEKPVIGDNGKSKLIFEVSEKVEGEAAERVVPGTEVKFESNKPDKVTVTPEKAVTDEKGQVSVEMEAKDKESFEGAEVTAKADVRYSDGNVPVETTVRVEPNKKITYTLACTNSPQTIDADGKASLSFTLTKVNGASREPIANTKVAFTATKGKCDAEGTTDSNGAVKVAFNTGEISIEDFDKATITATCTYDGKAYSGEGAVSGLEWTYKVECLDAQQTISAEYMSKATIWFRLTATSGSITKPLKHRTFGFTATNGKVESSSMSIYTDDDGQMAADFYPDDDLYCFEGATVTATFESSDGKTASAQGIVKGLDWTYTVACTNSGQAIDEQGKASLDFEVIAETDHPTEGHVKRWPSRALIAFSSSDGSVSPASGLTNDEGKATVVFQTNDVENFTEGKVTGAFDGTINGKTVKDKPHVKTEGTVVAPPKDGLDKPRGLKDNTYVVNDKEVTVEDLPEGEGMRDYIVYGEKKDQGVSKVFFIEFCKEHPVYATVGGGTIHIRPDQIGKTINMLGEDPDGVAWMNLFSLKDTEQGYDPVTNPDTSFSAPGTPDLEQATCKLTQNPDGSVTALAYFRTKDGKEAYFKMKATRKANWSD